ncbi:Cytochrome P450 CYP4/CYP19/CYP26 subfamily [Handroanthus impetiginosus]|uniref:Cytochrome P450 CYP4/CYP19/CYP26 subfamily n=1 Tax=Handroanthus impetiginosus TaxID=429701 RepID=A0A2G9H6F0_9LAMI|nr:Cytochrome P450 CYP4/CYP19/CYP26 subfamily [Handroanthus impetiginosus]
MAIFEHLEFFLIIPFIIYLFYLISRRGKTRPAPTNWPLVGMMPAVLQNLHRAHDYVTEVLSACGGTFELKGPWFCNLDMLFTSDPANIHHIFSRNFSNYPKGPDFRKIFEILGDGIFNADFELWEVHRKTTLSLLTHAKFSTCLERTVWHKVETGLLPVLDYFCKQGTDFDLQDVFQRFTFDNISKLVLDYDPCSLCVELPYVPSEKAFSNVVEPLLYRHLIPESLWKLQKWLKIGTEKKLIDAAKAFDEFIYPHVCLKKGDDRKEDGFNLLTAFAKVYEEKNIGSCTGLRDFLRDTSLNLMFAGRDTTSTCLTWLFWLIAKWRFFSVDESRKLIYLHGALCESLRLFPPVALEHKAPVRPDVLPSGHYIKQNSKIIVSFYSVGRMEAIWGKDCLEFRPERWISARGGIKHEPSYKFPAFNVGPRTCLGKEMAFIQMKMVAATIIYHYNVKLVEGHPVSPRDSIILQARNGLRVRLFKRRV